MPDDAPDPLLTLKQAATRLCVHPSTLRRWADKGAIAVVITPGGHRRFPKSAVEGLATEQGGMETTRSLARTWGEQALSHTRAEIAEHRADEEWLAEIDDEDRAQKRTLGRRLMGLMMQYLSLDADDGGHLLAEAEAIGRVYAESARTSGMDLKEALHATMFFRDNLIESAVLLPDTVRSHPNTNRRLLRRINTFLNAIQLAIADVYRGA